MIAERERLLLRARALAATRAFFTEAGFLEIDAPVAVTSPGLEPHLDAFELEGDGHRRYLHTSPEYALKRALGAGLERIYCLGPCFRDEPPSTTHSPEFTMLEWYAVGRDLHELMDQTEALVRAVCVAVRGETTVPRGMGLIDLGQPFARLTLREAFIQHAGVDPWGHPSAVGLRAAGRAAGVPVPTDSADWDDVFFQIFLNAVEPALAMAGPTFVVGYPASQAALARLDPDDPSVALRFELYAGGLELANAFDELIDAEEQRRRFEADRALRQEMGRPGYPIDEALLEAVGRMRPTVGIALGFDRLLMLVLGATHIDEVRVQAW